MPNGWIEPLVPPYGTDQNGNRVTPNTGLGFNYGAQQNSLGGYQQPGLGWTPKIGQPYANQISGSKSYSFIQPTPQKPSTPTHQWMGPTKPNNSITGVNKNIYSGTAQPTWQQQSAGKPPPSNPNQLYYKNPGVSPQQTQAKGWAAMRAEAQKPNPKNGALFQSAKNPLVMQAQAAVTKAFWTNAYQQLNAALRPVSIPLTTPQNNGGGYGDWYGYGGGGGGYKPQAQPLDSVVWRMNQ